MSFRFITKSIHAYLIDYPVAIVLIAAPFVLKLGQSEPGGDPRGGASSRHQAEGYAAENGAAP
jgi:hypothetical protein